MYMYRIVATGLWFPSNKCDNTEVSAKVWLRYKLAQSHTDNGSAFKAHGGM